MTFGIKLHDTSGHTKILTPDDGTIIAAGSITMPNTLEGDNTYGEDVALGATYDEDEISVIVVPRRPNYQTVYQRYIDGGTLYYNTFYLDSAETYYSRNPTTGVMTSYSAGNRTANSKSTWNPVLSVFPTSFWDKMGASTFSSVRLFAATTYLFRDTHADTNISLAGTAASTGTVNIGTATQINDNDTGTSAGTISYVGEFESAGTSLTLDSYITVTFASSQNITRFDMYHSIVAQTTGGGGFADGLWEIDLYYDGGWNRIQENDWHDETVSLNRTDVTEGVWNGVTKCRVHIHCVAQKGTGFTVSQCWQEIFEMRCWGNSYTNDQENSIVYSIGNKGVDTADYMVCHKRFT